MEGVPENGMSKKEEGAGKIIIKKQNSQLGFEAFNLKPL